MTQDKRPRGMRRGLTSYGDDATKKAKTLARRVLDSFEDSEYVVVPSGSCAAMMRVFYLDLFRDDPEMLKRAELFSSKVYEFSQFLTHVLGIEDTGSTYSGAAAAALAGGDRIAAEQERAHHQKLRLAVLRLPHDRRHMRARRFGSVDLPHHVAAFAVDRDEEGTGALVADQ